MLESVAGAPAGDSSSDDPLDFRASCSTGIFLQLFIRVGPLRGPVFGKHSEQVRSQVSLARNPEILLVVSTIDHNLY